MAPPSSYNLADLWEAVLPHVTDRTALVVDDRSWTYGELEERVEPARRTTCAGRASAPATTSAATSTTASEYVEAMLAAFKLRAVPINVNYRYVADELRYLCADAELKAIVHDPSFGERVDAVAGDLPLLPPG